MHHYLHAANPATTNREARALLAAKLAAARANGERAGKVKQMRREMWRLKAEAARHGWHGDVMLPGMDTVDRVACWLRSGGDGDDAAERPQQDELRAKPAIGLSVFFPLPA